MPACLPPRLPQARIWAARARGELGRAAEILSSVRLVGHQIAKAALSCCLAICVAEGIGFTLQSKEIAERFGERHAEWDPARAALELRSVASSTGWDLVSASRWAARQTPVAAGVLERMARLALA